MSEVNPEEFEINLPGVRISYPHLFEHAVIQGKNTGKYSAKFLISKEEQPELVKKVAKKIKEMIAATSWKKNKPPKGNLCMRDGDESGKEEEEGHWIISASESMRPVVVDRDRSPLAAEDEKIYAGCYVNAKIRLWAQDNQYGQRINANLLGVQFMQDGERLGNGIPRQSADEMFDTVDGFDDDDAFGGPDSDGDDPFA